MKIMVFTEGTIFTHSNWIGLAREEIVRRIMEGERPDYAGTVPIGEAARKIQAWSDVGVEILYLTSRRSSEEVEQVREVLQRYSFPSGELFFRLEGEEYKDAAERAMPEDVAEIEACLGEMTAAAGDNKAFTRADMRFHLAVARASRNQVLTQSYYFIQGLLEEAIERADALPGGIERALINHRDMLTGIGNRCPDDAQRASERQIMDVAEYFRQRELHGK